MRAEHRAAVEAGYASLPEYVRTYGATMNPHRLQPYSASADPYKKPSPVTGLEGYYPEFTPLHGRRINLWNDIFPEGYVSFNSVQAHSNVLVVERERHGVDHYNPRNVPAIPAQMEFDVYGSGDMVFLDLYLGIEVCQHVEWRKGCDTPVIEPGIRP